MSFNLSEITSRADALYGARAEPANVSECVRLLEQAAAESFEAMWRLSRALFFLGQEADDKREARLLHQRGTDYAGASRRIEPARVEGHFWMGVNLALLAQLENPLRALLYALSAKRSLERAIKIDPGFHAAGPLRVLARLQHRMPRLLGGDNALARANFEKAINLAPTNTVTRLYFAELLLDEGESERARLELEMLLVAPTDPAWSFETERDRELAREMIEKLKR